MLHEFPEAQNLVAQSILSASQLQQLLAVTGVVTCSASNLLAPGLQRARDEIEAIESEHIIGLCEEPRQKEELAILQACYSKAAIPNMFLNLLVNYRSIVLCCKEQIAYLLFAMPTPEKIRLFFLLYTMGMFVQDSRPQRLLKILVDYENVD